MSALSTTPMHQIAADGRLNVLHKIATATASELERVDFEEQYDYAADDREHVQLCRRWSRMYEPPTRKARRK